MKKHITLNDLSQLTENQKLRLSQLWKPEMYDLAAAFVCKDAENEEFDIFEFVIGKITINSYSQVFITDIKDPAIDSEKENDDQSKDSETSDVGTVLNNTIKGMESPFVDEDESEENEDESPFEFELEYVRPTCFNKTECIPLLNIGQMIDLLQEKGYGEGDFYITASTAEFGCELGKNSANWDKYGSDYDKMELCDVLWELVKTIL